MVPIATILKGGLDTRSLAITVHEFNWTKENNVIYDEDGVVIRSIPVIHLEGSLSFILEWKGMKISFSGDTLANRWWIEHAKGADLAVHECFLPNEDFITRYKFQPTASSLPVWLNQTGTMHPCSEHPFANRPNRTA